MMFSQYSWRKQKWNAVAWEAKQPGGTHEALLPGISPGGAMSSSSFLVCSFGSLAWSERCFLLALGKGAAAGHSTAGGSRGKKRNSPGYGGRLHLLGLRCYSEDPKGEETPAVDCRL
eukprot:TRINITY_DN65_c0_g1_i5.p2 TRINITY_DN65_c0_g1~~TRINITY_DN65_c0_g1_i5.p2  ORF type:complete len:117 (+),score=19.05 TRINITY_DN65_c0_g1_i5:416-766(+)